MEGGRERNGEMGRWMGGWMSEVDGINEGVYNGQERILYTVSSLGKKIYK